MHASSIMFYELESAVGPELSSWLILTQNTGIVLLLGVLTDVVSVMGTEWADWTWGVWALKSKLNHVCNLKRISWSGEITKTIVLGLLLWQFIDSKSHNKGHITMSQKEQKHELTLWYQLNSVKSLRSATYVGLLGKLRSSRSLHHVILPCDSWSGLNFPSCVRYLWLLIVIHDAGKKNTT